MTGLPISIALCASAFGQIPVAQDPPNAAESEGSSYVNTNFEAQAALSQAESFVASRKWSAAAAAFQAVGDTFGSSIERLDRRRFISVRDYVNRRISAWPAEGIAAYRQAFDGTATEALRIARQCQEIESLVEVGERYYATVPGAAALDAAADLAIERGDFASARQWLARLLANHPDRERQGEQWRAKAALCCAWIGDTVELREISKGLPPDQPGPDVTWGGRERPLGEFVRDILSEETLERDATTTAQPVMLGGGPDRRGFFESDATAEAVLWRFSPLSSVPTRARNVYESDSARSESTMRELQSGRRLSMSPVAGGGLIFVHNHRTVWAIDAESPDTAAWQYDLVDGPAQEPRWLSEEELPPLSTSTWFDGRLYVHLDRDPPSSIDGRVGESSVLVCIEARSGHEIWRNELKGFASKFEETRIDGAPLVHQGRLFAVVRRRKPFGFEACFLLRFDMKTGQLAWSTHVGEAATGSYGYRRATLSHPAAEGDLVFVQTNLGTIAAVSATTGRIAWLRRYKSRFVDGAEGHWPSRLGEQMRSWQYQPTVLWEDRVLCMPLDMTAILVLDQADGREISRIPLSQLQSPQYLLGVHGDLLYAVGTQVTGYDLRADEPAWTRPIADGQPLGRGAATSVGLFIPTTHALLRYPLDGGAARVHPWPLESAGNLIALPDQIVVASAESVFGLVGMEAAFSKLTSELTKDAGDPLPALRLAELAFNTDKYERALAAIDEAVTRSGGFATLTDDALRARFFRDLPRFAETLLDSMADPASDPAFDRVVDLLQKAGQCASGPEGQVTYRLQLAEAYVRRRDHAAAVQTYQQILGDRGLLGVGIKMRAHWRPPGGHDEVRNLPEDSIVEAGTLARVWIDRLVADFGPEVYAEVERRAQDRLKVAGASKDAAAMLAVAEEFPNSKSSTMALLAHARLMRDRSDWKSAARSYRGALNRCEMAGRPEMLREFAICLIQSGRPDVAGHWLNRATRDYPSERFAHNGRIISFKQLREELVGHLGLCDVTVPKMNWPVTRVYQRLHPDPVAVLNPTCSDLPETRWDTLLTYSGRSLELRQPATDRALWHAPVECPSEPVLLGMDADRFVFATRDRLFALTRTSGQPAWQVGEIPVSDPNTDPETIPSWTEYAMTPTRLFAANDRRELLCINLSDGAIRWRKDDGPRAGGSLVADREHVCFAAWKGRQNTLAVLDAESGETKRAILQDDDRPIQTLKFTPDGILLVVLSNSVIAVDPRNGETQWRIECHDHLVLSSLHVDPEGLFVSSDGRRIDKYDLETGRLIWSTPPLGTNKHGGLWSRISGGVLYAASSDTLAAYDTADGQLLWTAADSPGLTYAPKIVKDAIVTVLPEKERNRGHRLQGANEIEKSRYRILRFDLRDGRKRTSGHEPEENLDDVESFGGLFVRDRCLIILDGNRLIGYVGAEP